jgi:hypothetical protein
MFFRTYGIFISSREACMDISSMMWFPAWLCPLPGGAADPAFNGVAHPAAG